MSYVAHIAAFYNHGLGLVPTQSTQMRHTCVDLYQFDEYAVLLVVPVRTIYNCNDALRCHAQWPAVTPHTLWPITIHSQYLFQDSSH